MFREKFEKKLNTFKKIFHQKCLFCEAKVEEKGLKKTVLRLCEFCLNRYQALEEIKNDKERIREIADCFYGKCYFCGAETVKWEVEINSSAKVPKSGFFGEAILVKIHSCNACASRYDSFCKLEQENQQLQSELHQQLQLQIQVNPK